MGYANRAAQYRGREKDRKSYQNVVLMVPFDHEAFLALLDVAGQCTVGETAAPRRVVPFHMINDPAGIDPPEAENASDHKNGRADILTGPIWPDRRPRSWEHLPPRQGLASRVKDRLPVAQQHAVVIAIVACRRAIGRLADFRVGKRQRGLGLQETLELPIVGADQ